LEKGYTALFVKHLKLNAKPNPPIAETLRKALLTILGVVAELERAFIRERTIQGMTRLGERASILSIRDPVLPRTPNQFPTNSLQPIRTRSRKRDGGEIVTINFNTKHSVKEIYNSVNLILTYNRYDNLKLLTILTFNLNETINII